MEVYLHSLNAADNSVQLSSIPMEPATNRDVVTLSNRS